MLYAAPALELLHFPPFCLDTTNEELWRGSQQLALRPKAFAVLSYLIRHPQRLVTKQELLSNVWAHVAVGDELLRGYVRELRSTLGDDANHPRFLATIPRRGYKFLPEVICEGRRSPDDDSPPSARYRQGQRLSEPPRELAPDLAKLFGWFRRMLASERQIVFVGDEQGHSSAALLELFLQRLPPTPAVLVGRGRCSVRSGEPCQVILQALSELCESSEVERSAGLSRRLPELAGALEALCTRQPLVLALQDLHLADSFTVALLSLLARRVNPAKLMMIGSYRQSGYVESFPPLELLIGPWTIGRRQREPVLFRVGNEAEASSTAERAVRSTERTTSAPIKVGILHSLTGRMASSETAVVDATLLAIEELNRRGGPHGHRIEAIIADGQSDEQVFAREARSLILEKGVSTIFGCWTSASRKAVRKVVEDSDGLLIYPVQFEGMERSPNIVYTGAAPNQQILPAVRWAFGFLRRRRFFLVGSDSVFAWAAHAMIRDEVQALGGEILGEEYLGDANPDVAKVVDKIGRTKPDVIFNALGGELNIVYSRALRAAGITPDQIPTIYLTMSEIELLRFTQVESVGDYGAWNYFQSLDRAQNREFINRFRSRYGSQRVLADPMEAAYIGVHLWGQAVDAVGTDRASAVLEALRTQAFDAPEGPVRIDPESQYTWKTMRLGKIVEGGQFEVIWSSERPLRPEPFAGSRSPAHWDAFLADLFQRWEGRWSSRAG